MPSMLVRRRDPSRKGSTQNMMTKSLSVAGAVRVAGLALALCLPVLGPVQAQGPAPFQRLAGQWSGSGTIDLASGARERIRCRAAYDVLDRQNNLQLNIRCASESFNFDLRASAIYAGGAISGTWSEGTRNVAGTISGRASGEHVEVLATTPSFSASLSLTTRGNRQSVFIRPQDAQSSIKGASISLHRDG